MVYQNTDNGTDTGTENSVNTGTDTRYFDNSVLILIIGTFEITSTGTGNRYSIRVLTKGLVFYYLEVSERKNLFHKPNILFHVEINFNL